MARQVKLFLIRHGETVDNVAQLYAGSRDSALTNHGFQQATRLGVHFDTLGLQFTHFFSSHLQRAAKTAGLIRQAQVTRASRTNNAPEVPEVVQVPALMEQDFGYFEGRKYYERPDDSSTSGKEHHRQNHRDEPGFVDIESKESMAQRADLFLDAHLLPIFDESTDAEKCAIAIVSHGIMLSTLWKRLLLRLPPKSVTLSSDLSARTPQFTLEHLGGWSNTGYLELTMSRVVAQDPAVTQDISAPAESSKDADLTPPCPATETTASGEASTEAALPAASTAQPAPKKLEDGWSTLIQTINGKDHLGGLKRTRGGIGSAKHDTSQKNIDSFFKRRKVE